MNFGTTARCGERNRDRAECNASSNDVQLRDEGKFKHARYMRPSAIALCAEELEQFERAVAGIELRQQNYTTHSPRADALATVDRDSDAPSRSDASIPCHCRSRVSGRRVNRLGRRSRAHPRYEEPLHACPPAQTRGGAAAASPGGVGDGVVVGARRRAERCLAVLVGVSVTAPPQRLLSPRA